MEVVQNNLRPEIPENCPSQISRLIKKCWDRNPLLRPSFKEILDELKAMRHHLVD